MGFFCSTPSIPSHFLRNFSQDVLHDFHTRKLNFILICATLYRTHSYIPLLSISLSTSPKMGSTRPTALDFAHHINSRSKARHPSPLKDLIRLMGVDGMITLAGGMLRSLFTVLSRQNTDLDRTTTPISFSPAKGHIYLSHTRRTGRRHHRHYSVQQQRSPTGSMASIQQVNPCSATLSLYERVVNK